MRQPRAAAAVRMHCATAPNTIVATPTQHRPTDTLAAAPGAHRDHGQHVLHVRHHDIQQERPGRVQRLADGAAELARCDHAARRHAERGGHHDKVGVDVRQVARHVPLILAAAQVRVRAVGLPSALTAVTHMGRRARRNTVMRNTAALARAPPGAAPGPAADMRRAQDSPSPARARHEA